MDENKNPAEEAKKAWEAMQKHKEDFLNRKNSGNATRWSY